METLLNIAYRMNYPITMRIGLEILALEMLVCDLFPMDVSDSYRWRHVDFKKERARIDLCLDSQEFDEEMRGL